MGLTYALNDQARSVVRGGYGRFFDKSHFDIGITNLFTAGVFTNSVNAHFPNSNFDDGPRAVVANGSNARVGAEQRADDQPRLSECELPDERARVRTPGTSTVDNPDRKVSRSDQLSLGYEQQLAGDLTARADFVHVWGRDLLMIIDRNKGTRATTSPTAPSFGLIRTSSIRSTSS